MRFFVDQVTTAAACTVLVAAVTGRIPQDRWPYVAAGLITGFALGLVGRRIGWLS